LLYGQNHLVALPRNLDGTDQFELFSLLASADDVDGQVLEIQSEIESLGFNWLEYARVRWNGKSNQPISILDTYCPPKWLPRFCSRRYWEVDDRFRASNSTATPYQWTVAERIKLLDSEQSFRLEERNLLELFSNCGIGSGITVCLPTRQTGINAVVSLFSQSESLPKDANKVLAQAVFLCICLNEFFSMHTICSDGEAAGPTLSALQSRIAQCIHGGLSDKEVARKLGLSTYAVDYHLRTLRKKFGVRNRVQLALAIVGDTEMLARPHEPELTVTSDAATDRGVIDRRKGTTGDRRMGSRLENVDEGLKLIPCAYEC